MMRVLMVCLGNICRSPMAQAAVEAAAAQAGLAVEVDSAGTGHWHVGAPPDRRARAAAVARGLDISAQRARRVGGGDFHAFDLILAMDRANLAELERLRPRRGGAELRLFLDYAPDVGAREVPDPYEGGAAGFERALDLIDAGARGLAAELGERRSRGA